MSKTSTFNHRHFCGIAGAAIAARFVSGSSSHDEESLSVIAETAKVADASPDNGLQEVLDLLLTQELLVTFLTAGIELAAHTPSEAFLPVLRNAVTAEFVHGEAIKKAGGKPLTTSFWFPDAAFDGGRVGLFSTIEHVEEIEISLYLVGVSAYARARRVRYANVRRGPGRRGGRAWPLCFVDRHEDSGKGGGTLREQRSIASRFRAEREVLERLDECERHLE